MMMVPSEPSAMSLTAVKLLRSAHWTCGLTMTCRSRTSFDASSDGCGSWKVHTSPFLDRVAKVCPQDVTLTIVGSRLTCPGFFGALRERCGEEKLGSGENHESVTHLILK